MEEFSQILHDIITNEIVLQMKKIRHHCDTDCFTHCYKVSYICYKITKKLKLDYVSMARGAMLHDLFLYDWHAPKNGRKGFHAFTHGECARLNAIKLFNLNDKEQDIIKKHMWPVTIIPPKSIEGFILTIVDKYCTIQETVEYINNKRRKK